MRYFVGVASCGMSTKVIERVKAEKISFAASLLQTAMRTEPTRLAVQLDDSHERHLVVLNLCIANARYFGGGMKIAPDAKLTDGKFDVIGVADLSALIAGRGGVFQALQDPDFFAQVSVDPEAGTLVWPNGVDLDPDVLYELATAST